MRQSTHYSVVAAGVDTSRINCFGDLRPNVTVRLDALQARAIEERDAHRGHRRSALVETPWRLAGQPLLIAPHGGGKGQWRWLLRCPYATFELGLGGFNHICCRVTLSSNFLWRFGYRQAWAKAHAVIGTWVEELHGYQMSELHLCADVAGLNIASLRGEEFVHRGAVSRWHLEDAEILELVEERAAEQSHPQLQLHARYRELEGLSFSLTAPHSAVIYNKPREIRVKSRDKLWFADIWRRNGWNGLDPVARVEMRYDRTALRELGCESVTETYDRLDALWAYSTQLWLRHTIPNHDDSHRYRWLNSPWWEAVQTASFGRAQTAPAQRRKAHAFHEERTLATILGYLESWTAYRAGKRVAPTIDLSTVARELVHCADDHYLDRGSDFSAEVLKKRKRLGFAS
jgi:hypothetical protein